MRKRQFTPHLRNGRMIREGHLRKCKACGDIFEMKAGNQKYCPNCSEYVRYRGLETMESLVKRLKIQADQGGFPKIWTAREYNQEFLKSLIPRM